MSPGVHTIHRKSTCLSGIRWDHMCGYVGWLSVEVMQEHLQCYSGEDLDKKLKSMIVPRRKKIADFTKLHSAK